MTKAICIIGSPRNNGSTACLAGAIVEGMSSIGVRTSKVFLGDLEIRYCKGCRECETSGKCIQEDDMSTLIARILESEIVLLASPSYWGDVTGQMKVFIDRSLPLCNARTGTTPVPPGKIGISVGVRAGKSRSETNRLIEVFSHYFGHLGITPARSVTAEGVDRVSDMKDNQLKLAEAFSLGKDIREALKRT